MPSVVEIVSSAKSRSRARPGVAAPGRHRRQGLVRARGSRARPIGVGTTPRCSRSSSGPPTAASSAFSWWESEGWDAISRSAARVNEPSSTMTEKYCSDRGFQRMPVGGARLGGSEATGLA